ncbi:EscU/YscU/HrcU family type III secretion system export apparatus switch protein [Leptolyngbya sp. 15MV]|nr:EscU/YscU/HrcU family type III secretion system export apparatus switch protein [Leptolyngbya sp. 15MV]
MLAMPLSAALAGPPTNEQVEKAVQTFREAWQASKSQEEVRAAAERALADFQPMEWQVAGQSLSVDGLGDMASYAALQALKVLGPGLLIMFMLSALAQFVQVGPLLTVQPLEPKLERLNPVAGFTRLFKLRNLVKTGMSLVKLALVVPIVSIFVWVRLREIASLPLLEVLPGMVLALRLVLELIAWLLALLLILGLIDYAYQRWQHIQDNRMTKQEVTDERRAMDGDPDVKSRRMRMARDIAMQRIGRDVPGADVVVTNPTHFSVALRYDASTMRAPRVVAKGADEMAMRVREVARAHGVPIVERPPLARALYWNVDVGREIDPEFYEAVAEVLAYVYRLERDGSAGEPASAAEPVGATT